jgi:hypothetical protein
VFKDKNSARYVNELFLDINGRLNESLEKLEPNCSPEEFAAYRRCIGRMINSIFEEILEPIYIEHVDLKPAELEM